MFRIILILLSFTLLSNAFCEDQKIIYQYKKYEKFDLGNLEVKGQLIAPGDISVRERERRRFELDLFNRQDFDSFIKKDVESLR
jgi:hypothetical protein